MRQLNSMKWNRAVISILRNSDLYPLYTKDSIFSPVRTAPHPAATQESSRRRALNSHSFSNEVSQGFTWEEESHHPQKKPSHAALVGWCNVKWREQQLLEVVWLKPLRSGWDPVETCNDFSLLAMVHKTSGCLHISADSRFTTARAVLGRNSDGTTVMASKWRKKIKTTKHRILFGYLCNRHKMCIARYITIKVKEKISLQ